MRTEDIWQEKRKSFLDTINERVRTMALGGLVLIWGLFTGESHKDVAMTKGSRISLLVVASGAVGVLLIEYIEQWTGYLGAKQALPGSKVKPYGFSYTQISKRAFSLKHLLGISTIVTLIVVLAMLLIQTVVHGQTADQMQPYIGNWCGTDRDGNNYMHLDVEYEADHPRVTFNWRGEDPSSCSDTTIEANDANFECEDGDLSITGTRDRANLDVHWYWKGSASAHDQTLVDCNQ